MPTSKAPEILDACCGGRMWWWDKAHPLACYLDKRTRPAGTIRQKPLWCPDTYDHIGKVRYYVGRALANLINRAQIHDASKLVSPASDT